MGVGRARAVGAAVREKGHRFGGKVPGGLSWRKVVEAIGRPQVTRRRNPRISVLSVLLKIARNHVSAGGSLGRDQRPQQEKSTFRVPNVRGTLLLGASWRRLCALQNRSGTVFCCVLVAGSSISARWIRKSSTTQLQHPWLPALRAENRN